MGYTTDFEGSFVLNKPLAPEHLAYLKAFKDTRRMSRNATVIKELVAKGKLSDILNKNAGLPLGTEGEFFVGGLGFCGQDRDESVIDHNRPPKTQPGLWCQWEPNEAGTYIFWDGGEKFYDYDEWIKYIIANFIAPWGYELNGEVNWYGEDRGDIGILIVKKNKLKIKHGHITYR